MSKHPGPNRVNSRFNAKIYNNNKSEKNFDRQYFKKLTISTSWHLLNFHLSEGYKNMDIFLVRYISGY